MFYNISIFQVHECYGQELGLTSDDEYIDPYETKLSADSVSEEPETKGSSSSSDQKVKKTKKLSSSSSSSCAQDLITAIPNPSIDPTVLTNIAETKIGTSNEQCPTDMSDSTDSESDKKMEFVNDAECNSMHEGRQLVHTILPINIETVFGILFHKSQFFSEFHKMRKTTDLEQGEWVDMPDGTKQRVISLTVAITQVVGPKSSHVTETQVMRTCSKPGQLYSIDATSVNSGEFTSSIKDQETLTNLCFLLGIPYADSFCVHTHYCMRKTADDSTMMSVHAQIKYKKSVWGVIKGFIEKNTWLGLEDFYHALSSSLAEVLMPPAKAKSRRTRKGSTQPMLIDPRLQPATQTKYHEKEVSSNTASTTNTHAVKHVPRLVEKDVSSQNRRQETMSWIVIILLTALIAFNVILYIKLWRIDGRDAELALTRQDLLR